MLRRQATPTRPTANSDRRQDEDAVRRDRREHGPETDGREAEGRRRGRSRQPPLRQDDGAEDGARQQQARDLERQEPVLEERAADAARASRRGPPAGEASRPPRRHDELERRARRPRRARATVAVLSVPSPAHAGAASALPPTRQPRRALGRHADLRCGVAGLRLAGSRTSGARRTRGRRRPRRGLAHLGGGADRRPQLGQLDGRRAPGPRERRPGPRGAASRRRRATAAGGGGRRGRQAQDRPDAVGDARARGARRAATWSTAGEDEAGERDARRA